MTFTVTDDGEPPLSDTEEVVITVGEVRLVCLRGLRLQTRSRERSTRPTRGMSCRLPPGTYRENLRIDKSLTLRRGAGMEIPSLDVAADVQGAFPPRGSSSAAMWMQTAPGTGAW